MIYGPQPLPNLNGPEQSVGQNYVYDAWNRLVSVGEGSTTYQYDGLDRKVEMTNNGWSGEVTYYFYAGQQMIEEAGPLAGAEDPRSLRDAYEYVYSARGGNIPILRDLSQYSYPGGQPSVTGRFYYLTDADNNVTTLVSANGSVLERCLYDAYGTALFGGASWSNFAFNTTLAYGNTILFGCMDLDAYTGLYHTETRWYDPMLGVFLTRDPAQADVNLYRYCGNNPVSYTDPTGLYAPQGVLKFGRPLMAPWGGLVQIPGYCKFSGFVTTRNFPWPNWNLTGYTLTPMPGFQGTLFYAPYTFWSSDGSTTMPQRSTGRDWVDKYSNWFRKKIGGGDTFDWLGQKVIYPVVTLVVSNATFANASPWTLFIGTTLAAIPIGIGLFVGGEVILGVGTFGGEAVEVISAAKLAETVIAEGEAAQAAEVAEYSEFVIKECSGVLSKARLTEFIAQYDDALETLWAAMARLGR